MQLKEKEQFVEDFKKNLEKSQSIILAGYQGLGVNNLNELRRKLRKTNCTMKVVKNRLAVRAIGDLGQEEYSDIFAFFKGPTAVLLGDDDPTGAIKIFKEYINDNELMEFRAGVVAGRFLEKEQIDKLADLPSREVLLGKAVGVINAPVQGLYNSLAGLIRKLFYGLNDLKEKIEKGEIKPRQAEAESAGDTQQENPSQGEEKSATDMEVKEASGEATQENSEDKKEEKEEHKQEESNGNQEK